MEYPTAPLAFNQLVRWNQWVCWNSAKRPFTPYGRPASLTDPSTWHSFDECFRERVQCRYRKDLQGVGFVLGPDDPFVGLGLDKCIVDGKLEFWARNIVETMDSYTELSPSGNGVHIICEGQIPRLGRRTTGLEIYSSRRYFPFTGQQYPGAPEDIRHRQNSLNAIWAEHFPTRATGFVDVPANAGGACHVILDPLRQPPADKLAALIANNAKFRRSWNHKRRDMADPSNSAFDLSLAMLARNAGWSDQEIADLIVIHRRQWGGVEKAMRNDYMTRLLRHAKSAGRDGMKEKQARNALPLAEPKGPRGRISSHTSRCN